MPGGTDGGSERRDNRILDQQTLQIQKRINKSGLYGQSHTTPTEIPYNKDIKRRPMPKDELEPSTETLAETDNYVIWKAEEPDGETTYNLQLNNVTVNFFKEEWDEFLELIHSLK